jgi:uncharacterized protein YeaO (DUF488 family)
VSETALEGKRAFDFVRMNEREGKPRNRGVTEIRGAYYTPVGRCYLSDVLETMGEYVDSLKFAGGSFTLMPDEALKGIIETAHEHEVMVSTGGFVEYVLTQGPDAVDRYIRACREVGFDIIELSGGFISIPTDDWLRLVERVQKSGLKAKPEVGIQFGAGGDPAARHLGHQELLGTGADLQGVGEGMALRVKRVYEEPEKADGERILVDHIWPRGISKEKARLSDWRRDLAPSNDLRRWFGHDLERWEEFEERYRAELEEAGKMGDLRDIAERAREENVTLLFGAKDTKHNNARALEAFVGDILQRSHTR